MIKILYNFFNAVKNNLEILENLLAYQKIDLNIQSADGYTALMVAARWGESEIVEKLLASGANSNTQNKYGYTALILASEWGHTSIVEKLLASGANPNIQNKYGNTALMLASRWGKTEVVDLLLEQTTEKFSKELYSKINPEPITQFNETEDLLSLPILAQKSFADFNEIETNTSIPLW